MKTFKILLCSFTLAAVVQAKSDEFASDLVTLPTLVVEATRIADPAVRLRAQLHETRAELAAPTRINVSSELLPQYSRETMPAKPEKRTLTS
jgi:hypothetical protein